jgi:hypothetical protein
MKSDCAEPEKLTPEQVKAIRWPDLKDKRLWAMYLKTPDPQDMVNEFIRYALQDLMPEKRE